MGNHLENQRIEGVNYSADDGCTIGCLTDLIRKRAYELFNARGSDPGSELEDWLRAEQEIKHHLGL